MKYLENFIVEKKIKLNRDNFLLALKSPISLYGIKSGQFVNVEVKDVADRILRRPISIYDVDKDNNILYLVVQRLARQQKSYPK